jgi:transglutaminase-like putative cysteine protease
VRKHAADAVADETDPWKAAELMEHWVWENLKKKNFSTLLASAAEVAKDLSGDCTEHAVLLAAMCRAREIPSRVAVGLVYVPELSSFGGHMWAEVYVNGKWVPLDATLGKGGIAADHIKFADSSFSDEGDAAPLAEFLPMVSVLSKLKIEIREVKHGP